MVTVTRVDAGGVLQRSMAGVAATDIPLAYYVLSVQGRILRLSVLAMDRERGG